MPLSYVVSLYVALTTRLKIIDSRCGVVGDVFGVVFRQLCLQLNVIELTSVLLFKVTIQHMIDLICKGVNP
jgi:hypothetical protein